MFVVDSLKDAIHHISCSISIDVTLLIAMKQNISDYRHHLHLLFSSAGVGRTGTFIALDALKSRGVITKEVDIYMYVEYMRKCRVNMVQTLVSDFIPENTFN